MSVNLNNYLGFLSLHSVFGKWVSNWSNSQSVHWIMTGNDPVIKLNYCFPSLALFGTAVETCLLIVALYLTLLGIDCHFCKATTF